MGKVWSLVTLVFYLGAVPFLMGSLYVPQCRKLLSAVRSWGYGMITMMAAYQIVCVPLILLHRPLTETVILWHVLLAGWLAVCFFLRIKQKTGSGEDVCGKKWKNTEFILLGVLLFFVLSQCAFYALGMHVDDDDARYVANAVAAWETNTMFHFHPNNGEAMSYFMGEIGKEVTSPIMMYYAALSMLLRIHPTILCHTILPTVLLILSYCILWLLSDEIWPKERQKRLIFLILCAVFRIMGNTSTYTDASVILMRLWQGKALVPAVFLPFILVLYLRFYMKMEKPYPVLLLLTGNVAACLASGMGIYLTAIMTGCCAVALMIRQKSFRSGLPVLLCCIPNLCYAGIYLLILKVILR